MTALALFWGVVKDVGLRTWMAVFGICAAWIMFWAMQDARQLAADRLVVINGLTSEANKVNDTANKVVIEYVDRYIDRVKYIKGETHVIEKQVPIYIPADTPPLPGGFRLLHDAAAQGRAIAAGTSPDAGNPVSVEDVALTVAANYSQCLQDKEKIVFWQSTYLKLCEQYGCE